MPITPLPVRRVQVYELLNITRLASLLAITGDDESVLRARLRREPPPELSRWDLDRDDISVQLLSSPLPPDAAQEFVRLYLKTMRANTWHYHVWAP